MDKLAETGVKFTQFYAAAAVTPPCMLSRHRPALMDKVGNTCFPKCLQPKWVSMHTVINLVNTCLTCPVFKKVTITLENGKKFIIEANNNSKENVYIQSATLNGKTYSHNWITYTDIINGGVLHYEMGNQPEKTRGTKIEDRPFSVTPF